MSERVREFGAPGPAPLVRVSSDYGAGDTRVFANGVEIAGAFPTSDLNAGVQFDADGEVLCIVADDAQPLGLSVTLGGSTLAPWKPAAQRAGRKARIFAAWALAASVAGFIASGLYLVRAWENDSAWALKMAYHMAGWHALLTVVLAPGALLFGRAGVRIVQITSALFFAIHIGIAAANAGSTEAVAHTGWIAVWNALSAVAFLLATFYGNSAHREYEAPTAETPETADASGKRSPDSTQPNRALGSAPAS